jgi:hypothetical protein
MTKKILEADIKNDVKKLLNQYMNVSWFMPAASIYGKSGIADFVCCVSGKYIEIETKAPGKKQTALQMQHEIEIRHHAYGQYVVVSCDEQLTSLETILLKMGAALKVVMKDGRVVK